jgi:tetratricopeptide (TPR) repeat protein
VGLSDWFDHESSATRRVFYDQWLLALSQNQRWEKVLAVSEGIQPLEEAKSGPRLGSYRLYRAQALSHLGKHAEAAAAHSENGRMGDPKGFPNACAEARLAKDWMSLFTMSDEYLEKTPKDAMGMAWKGEALSRMDMLPDAEPLLREAVAKDATIAFAWSGLGRCLKAKKAWAESAEALDKALSLDPKQMEDLFNRGIARFELKRYVDSRDDFKAALVLQPQDPVIIANLEQAERYATVPPTGTH